MRAKELYGKLNVAFIKEGIKDIDWANRMPNLHKHLFLEFIQNGGMGLMCDFTNEIERVFVLKAKSEATLNILKNMRHVQIRNVQRGVLVEHAAAHHILDFVEHGRAVVVDQVYTGEVKAVVRQDP